MNCPSERYRNPSPAGGCDHAGEWQPRQSEDDYQRQGRRADDDHLRVDQHHDASHQTGEGPLAQRAVEPPMNANTPSLETPRLRLRTMQAEDVDQLLAIFADPKVMAAFGVQPFDRAQMEHWVQRNLDNQTAHGYGLFSVILKTNGLLIGDCGLELMDVDGLQVAELGYDFRSDYWHQGYATEAAGAVRDYAFSQLGLPRLISLIRVGNLPSQRVAERIGMQLAAEITRYSIPYWLYALDRETAARRLLQPDAGG